LELLVVAAEASADLHGAAVLRELRRLLPEVRAFGAAGPLLRAEGCEALVRAEDLSVMGVAEVLPALPRIFDAMDALADAARERRPRAALLIDSPDFNLRLAQRLKQRRIPVVYFIGPKVWAWRTYRVRQIAASVLRMLVILPFEADFYQRHGVRATFVGNPTADAHRAPEAAADRAALRRSLGLDPGAKVLALLPGSRRQEIERLFPPMLDAAALLRSREPGLQIAVPVAPTVDRAALVANINERSFTNAILVDGRAPEVLAAADAAVVASGTATLEAALAQVPTVVVYRLSWLSWLLGRLLVRVKFVSLINLLAGRALVPELLQGRCTPELIAAEAAPLLEESAPRAAQLHGMRALRDELAPAGSPGAARRAAAELCAVLRGSDREEGA
jgi:lipid-A-disaccharide synthase